MSDFNFDFSLGAIIGASVGALTGYAQGGGAYTPASLFAAGEQGAWYDPNDFTTMFQDSFGTTPVTAVGQSIGSILGKRNGVPVLGPELIGTPTGYNANSSVSISGDVVTVTCTADGLFGVSGPIATAAKVSSYQFQYDILSISGGGSGLYVAAQAIPERLMDAVVGLVRYVSQSTGAAGSYPAYIIRGGAVIGDSFTLRLSTFSVRELPGNHAFQSDAAKRPLLVKPAAAYYRDFDAVDDAMVTTFPDLGTNVTIARSIPGTGASILTGQTIAAGAWSTSTDDCALVIINRALTGPETTSLTAYLNAKAGV